MKAIQDWAAGEGLTTQTDPASIEYAKIVIRDPSGGPAFALIPNAHHGRRLPRHKVRYVIRTLNDSWQD